MTLNTTKILPAEWDEQQFVQLTWPHANTDWAEMLDEVNECFVNIASEIIKHEDLLIVCVDSDEVEQLLLVPLRALLPCAHWAEAKDKPVKSGESCFKRLASANINSDCHDSCVLRLTQCRI